MASRCLSKKETAALAEDSNKDLYTVRKGLRKSTRVFFSSCKAFLFLNCHWVRGGVQAESDVTQIEL